MAGISRRAWLKTFAGFSSAAAVGHFDGLFRSAFAQSSTPPLRLITLTQPHGITPYWQPRAAGGGPALERGWTLAFDPDSSLGPLERHKDSMVIIDGLDFTCCYGAGSTGSIGHHSALAALTGSDLRGAEDRRSKGPSIDIFLASLLQVSPLVFTFYDGLKSWGPTGEVWPEVEDMVSEYQRLFGNLTGTVDPQAQAKRLADQRVLSYLRADANRLRSRLAAAERVKLDAHLESLAAIERRLTPPATCARPPAPMGRGDTMAMPQRHELAMRYISTALACGLTRVATCHMAAGATMPWLDLGAGAPAVHNDIVHAMVDTDDLSVRRVSRIHRWYAEQVAALCDQLKAIPEGEGTLYDHTLIVWTNELGNPRDHQPWNVPFVLLGGGGTFSKGRYLRVNPGSGTSVTAREGNAHNRLLTSVANQFGAGRTFFGEPAYPGELAAL